MSSEPLTVHGIDGLQAIVGRDLGPSSSIVLDQSLVNAFAEVTGDRQWIHIDPERAARESPFGGPVAHGYLVLSLVAPLLFGRLLRVEGISTIINYGADKLRFPDVARVGAELTLRARLERLEPRGPGHLATFSATFEIPGSTKPCCAVSLLLLFVP